MEDGVDIEEDDKGCCDCKSGKLGRRRPIGNEPPNPRIFFNAASGRSISSLEFKLSNSNEADSDDDVDADVGTDNEDEDEDKEGGKEEVVVEEVDNDGIFS